MKKQVLIILCIIFAFGTVFAQVDLQPLATIKLNKTESVTLKQLKERCEVYKKQTGLTSFTVEQKMEILDALIDEKLILQAAAKAGISFTDSQVQEIYLNSLASQIGAQQITEQQFAALVKEQTGLSLDDFFKSQLAMTAVEYKNFLKNQALAQNYVVLQRKAQIEAVAATDAEIRDYYEMNKPSFYQNDVLKLFLIIVPKTVDNAKLKAEALYESIKNSNMTFDEIKVQAGNEGYFQAGDMYVAKNATAANQLGIDYTELLKLFEMQDGEFSKLTETGTDYQFYIARGITPARLLLLSDVIAPDSTTIVYDFIRDNLTRQKQNLYFAQAVEEITTSLRSPENYQMLKSGDALIKLLENW